MCLILKVSPVQYHENQYFLADFHGVADEDEDLTCMQCSDEASFVLVEAALLLRWRSYHNVITKGRSLFRGA